MTSNTLEHYDDNQPPSGIMRFLARGKHEIEVVHEHILHDAARDKDIPLRIYAPLTGGPYPLVVFSHGAGDSNATSPLLLRHWASHGYVVIAPTHLFGARPLIERSLLRLREELRRPQTQGPEAWRERTGDLVSVMNHADALMHDVPLLRGKIDSTRMGIAGHSFGGYTVMLLGGATLTEEGKGVVHRFSDPRPRGVIIISGPGRDDMGLTRDSWDEFIKPLLVMAGSRDPGYLPSGTMWRAEPYHFAPPGDKYLLYLRGAHHLSYVGPVIDIPSRDPAQRGPIANWVRTAARSVAKVLPAVDQTGLFDYSRIASLAFLDAYVKDDASAIAFLQSKELERYSLRNARLSYR
ncbi:MAG: hypothetical protein IT366_15420 [Candidatus Hydrogenedentes bacterium]|nr:hypothetical protein [Candidatus Hydrogenedentota bacterium]